MPEWVIALFGAATGISAGACAWFIVRLHWTSRGDWRRSVMGRHTMALAGVLFVLLTVTHPLLRGLPWRPPAMLAGTLGLAAVLVWRVILLERTQRSNREGIKVDNK